MYGKTMLSGSANKMLYKVDLDISGVMNPRKLIVSQPTFHAGRIKDE